MKFVSLVADEEVLIRFLIEGIARLAAATPDQPNNPGNHVSSDLPKMRRFRRLNGIRDVWSLVGGLLPCL